MDEFRLSSALRTKMHLLCRAFCCLRASEPDSRSQHEAAALKLSRALTLKALSDSMDSRSPSKGIRSRLYCSRWMKDPSTPCSFSHCSHSRLRRGTKRMWKSLWGERPLSSLEESRQGHSKQSQHHSAAQPAGTARAEGTELKKPAFKTFCIRVFEMFVTWPFGRSAAALGAGQGEGIPRPYLRTLSVMMSISSSLGLTKKMTFLTSAWGRRPGFRVNIFSTSCSCRETKRQPPPPPPFRKPLVIKERRSP